MLQLAMRKQSGLIETLLLFTARVVHNRYLYPTRPAKINRIINMSAIVVVREAIPKRLSRMLHDLGRSKILRIPSILNKHFLNVATSIAPILALGPGAYVTSPYKYGNQENNYYREEFLLLNKC